MAVRELESPPRILPLLFRGAVKRGAAWELSDQELVLRGRTFDPAHVAAYCRVCGFTLRDELPPPYPHVAAFPLAVELMADSAFPFPLAGLVHIANVIEQRRPLRMDDEVDIWVRADNLRPHRRGSAFDVVTRVTSGGRTLWRERSTYLHRGRPPGEPSADPTEALVEGAPDRVAARWRVAADTGRRYAAVSGDHNPIHLHPLSARAFGFPRAIAHGMWSLARCAAALEGESLDPLRISVAFRKPVLLPSTVTFACERRGEGWAFALRSAKDPGILHLAGEAVASRVELDDEE